MFIAKTLWHIFFLFNPSFPFLGLKLALKIKKKFQLTDFPEKLS